MHFPNEIKLTAEQETIISQREGQHLVLAPAGTGKTEILSHNVLNTLAEGLEPEEMICLTFTNRAARVMAERVAEKIDGKIPFIGNIHRFALRFLLENELIPKAAIIFDEEDSSEIISQLIKKYGRARSSEKEIATVNRFLKGLSLEIPLELLDLPDYVYHSQEEIHKICTEYEIIKNELMALDFDDLLLYLYHALHQQEKHFRLADFRWIQVDEVQDINMLQWAIIEKLGRPNAFRIYFGDYEQAIFSFMGARIENLTRAATKSRLHNLTLNFRSPEYIIHMLNCYLTHNLKKKWVIESQAAKKAPQAPNSMIISKINGPTEVQDDYIAEKLLPDLLSKEDAGMTAILVRTNRRADELSFSLNIARLSHFRISGFDLFRRRITKDLMAWLNALISDNDRMAWSRLLWLAVPSITLTDARNFMTQLFELGMSPAEMMEPENEKHSLISRFNHHFYNERIVLLDTETVGLDTEKDDIIQIAAVEWQHGEISRTFNQYLQTQQEIGESESVHLINNELLQSIGQERKSVLTEFAKWLNGAVVLAHNSDFDLLILKNNFEREAIPFPKIIEIYDTITLTRRLFPTLHSYKLKSLLEKFSLEGVNSHNALDDVKATLNLAQFLAAKTGSFLHKQYQFLSDNSKIINQFRQRMGEPWQALQHSQKPQSMRALINRFFEFTKPFIKPYVDEDFEELERLLRHMDAQCPALPPLQLLKKILPRYRLYKEADLVLGNEQILLSTIHKAKGMEFQRVIIPDADDINYFSSIKAEQREEMARLLYVALSRSKSEIHICYATFPNTYSRKKGYASLSHFLEPVKKFFIWKNS
ncbi:MAG TPA: hypothetical protein ENN84_08205 [Candidatus Marinimicrobia bacterium]|nr:hypothetical protein [Candidatus Neomarinimicrobiota bacterium]